MKATSTLKGALLLCTLFSSIISCKKDDDLNISGDANVMIVNAAQGTTEQIFLLDNIAVNSNNKVGYARNTTYYSTKAGNERKAEFRNNDGTLNVSFDVTLETNKYYSLYLIGSGTTLDYLKIEDDMTLPANGKTRVRFVHVSPAAPSSIDIGLNSGAKLITNLPYKGVSAYYDVDPNSSIQLYSSGSSTVALSTTTGMAAGKVYTIYLAGATIANVSLKGISQN